MSTPLQPIDFLSIYKVNNAKAALPSRMALCTPDTSANIFAVDSELSNTDGKLILSDLFRSYEMQLQSHNDYVSGRKSAFSPAPGGSMHEAGRAMDIDLDSIGISLKDFWTVAGNNGFTPIISEPKAGVSESWHFDCRGSHQLVYDYYKSQKGTNFKPYTAMAKSAILSIDVKVDSFGANQKQAQLQSGLIRLEKELGNIDGAIGAKTQKAVEELGITFDANDIDSMLAAVENLLKAKFTEEYEINP